MLPRERDSLRDILKAGKAIQKFTAGASLTQYAESDLLRSAVERQFTILGEALVRLRDIDDEWVDRIPDARRIIGFRNVLVHGYDVIADDRIWDAIQTNLPGLLDLVGDLLDET